VPLHPGDRPDNGPDYVADVDATVDLWRGGSYKDNVTLHRDTMDPQLLVGRYYFCPGIDEPGTYRLGQTDVSWSDADYTLAGTFIDETTGFMVAKQATRAYLSGMKSGRCARSSRVPSTSGPGSTASGTTTRRAPG